MSVRSFHHDFTLCRQWILSWADARMHCDVSKVKCATNRTNPCKGRRICESCHVADIKKMFREINQDLCWGEREMQNTSQGAPVDHKNLHALRMKNVTQAAFLSTTRFQCLYLLCLVFFRERLIWVFSVVVSHGRCSSSRDPCGEHLNSFKKVTERERANNIMDATCPCALLLGHFPLRLTHPSRMRSLGIYFIVLPTRWIKYAALSLLCVCAWEESLENAFDTRTHTRTPRLGYFVLCGEVSSSSSPPPWRA